jgi:hypothetical protein
MHPALETMLHAASGSTHVLHRAEPNGVRLATALHLLASPTSHLDGVCELEPELCPPTEAENVGATIGFLLANGGAPSLKGISMGGGALPVHQLRGGAGTLEPHLTDLHLEEMNLGEAALVIMSTMIGTRW